MTHLNKSTTNSADKELKSLKKKLKEYENKLLAHVAVEDGDGVYHEIYDMFKRVFNEKDKTEKNQ
jgi:hypothetical protein